MKFLCVECDQPMALQETRGPVEGSLTVVFQCGSCGKQTAMLTNAMETQMVHSLGVKVGGRTEPAAPMETIRSNLDGVESGDGAVAEPEPHSAEWYAQKLGAGTPEKSESGGCPFSGMVAGQIEAAAGLTWTAEAEARMERIPSFVRGMVRKSIEDAARETGAETVDVSLIERVRGSMGM